MPWDPRVLARVRHLHLKARVLTDALLMGDHRSRRVGQAIEFADYQEYAPGMDLRGLDWKVWARSDRWVVKRYVTETELPCAVVLDLSGDLGTGSAGIAAPADLPDLDGSKAGYAITLTATLLYWFFRQGEPVGLSVVGGEGLPHRRYPTRAGRSHLQQMFLALAQARPGGRAELGERLVEVGSRLRRRSFVAVLSDGMEEPETWLPALGAFARRGTDLRFLHLFDPDELRLGGEQASLYFSPEGGEALAVDPVAAREEFREVVAEYLDEVRGGVLRVGGRYLSVPSSRSLESVVRAVVQGGSDPAEAP